MSKDELLAIIDDMRERIAVGDSYEGFVNYLLPDDGDDFDAVHFRARAGYRYGNLEGQGGFRAIGFDFHDDAEPRYRRYPDHPLYTVPIGVLDAARSMTREAGRWNDLDPEQAEAIADAVVARIIERGFEITPKGGADV